MLSRRRKMLMEKITFTDENTGENQDFYILDETVINEVDYLLVTDSDPDAEEAECYILRKTSDNGEEVSYEAVEDENTLKAVYKVFSEELEDTDIEF